MVSDAEDVAAEGSQSTYEYAGGHDDRQAPYHRTE